MYFSSKILPMGRWFDGQSELRTRFDQRGPKTKTQNPKPEFIRCTFVLDEIFIKKWKSEKSEKKQKFGFWKMWKGEKHGKKKRIRPHGPHTDDTKRASWLWLTAVCGWGISDRWIPYKKNNVHVPGCAVLSAVVWCNPLCCFPCQVCYAAFWCVLCVLCCFLMNEYERTR